jgi:hypothetical protein
MKEGAIGLGTGTEILLMITEAEEAVKAVIAAGKAVIAVTVKVDLAEGTAKASTAVIGKAAEAKRAVIVARADGAAKAAMAEAERVDLSGTETAETAGAAAPMEASPEEGAASTGTVQKNILILKNAAQGKKQRAGLALGLTAPGS